MNKLAQTTQIQTVFPQITSMLSQLATMLPELAPQTRALNLSLITAQRVLQTAPTTAPAQNNTTQPEQPKQSSQQETVAPDTINTPAPPAPSYSGGEGLATVGGSNKFRFVYAQEEEEAETDGEQEQQGLEQSQEISSYDRSIQVLEVLSQFDMHTFWGLLQQALDFAATQPTNPVMIQVSQQIQSYATALATYVERLNLLASSPRTTFIS